MINYSAPVKQGDVSLWDPEVHYNENGTAYIFGHPGASNTGAPRLRVEKLIAGSSYSLQTRGADALGSKPLRIVPYLSFDKKGSINPAHTQLLIFDEDQYNQLQELMKINEPEQ